MREGVLVMRGSGLMGVPAGWLDPSRSRLIASGGCPAQGVRHGGELATVAASISTRAVTAGC